MKGKTFLKNGEQFEKSTGVLLYQIGTKLKSQFENRLQFLVENVVKKNLNSELQLTGKILKINIIFNFYSKLNIFVAAFEYLLSNPTDPLDVKKFNEFCGVGVVITPEQIKNTVI